MKVEICEHCGKPGDYPRCDAPRKPRKQAPCTSCEALQSRVAELERERDEYRNLLVELRDPLHRVTKAITNEALHEAQDALMPVYGRVFYRIPKEPK